MNFDFIDNYLLEGHPAKADLIREVLAKRSPQSEAAPFYRALQTLGDRAADEAIVALRLVLAGKPASDEAVKRLRQAAISFRLADEEEKLQSRAAYERELR